MKPLFPLFILSCLLLATAGSSAQPIPDVLNDPYRGAGRYNGIFQYSTIGELISGGYDGDMTIGDLKTRGDIGIGLFNGLDGELLLLDSVAYRLNDKGEAVVVSDAEKTPFAIAKFFKADRTIVMSGSNLTFGDVVKRIYEELGSSSMCAVKIRGHFKTVKASALRPVSKPYPPLAKYAEDGGSVEFSFADVEGVCAGFWLAPSMARGSLPGLSVSFLSQSRTQGGNVSWFIADRLEIEISGARRLLTESNPLAGSLRGGDGNK